MFKKIFILFTVIYYINLNSAQYDSVDAIRATEQYTTLDKFCYDAFGLPHPVDFTPANTSYLVSVMNKLNPLGSCQILTQLIVDKFSNELTFQAIYILNNVIFILIQNNCLDCYGQGNLLSVLLNLNFDYEILKDLPKNLNFILMSMYRLRENISALNKTDKYLFLKYLFCSLRNKFEYNDSGCIYDELSYFLSLHEQDVDFIRHNNELNSLIEEMHNLIGEKIPESNDDQARCLAIFSAINQANKNSKAVFIATILFADYLKYLDPNFLNAKCVNLIIQILQNNDFEDYVAVFNKDTLLMYFEKMNPDNVFNLDRQAHIKILENIYSEQIREGEVIEYVSVLGNLNNCNSVVFSANIEQAFKDDLIQDIIDNQRNKSFYGLLWYIKHSSENEGFENKLNSDNLQMILERLESKEFSDLPQLSQKEWTSLVKKKYITSVRTEQYTCCIQ